MFKQGKGFSVISVKINPIANIFFHHFSTTKLSVACPFLFPSLLLSLPYSGLFIDFKRQIYSGKAPTERNEPPLTDKHRKVLWELL